MCNTKIYGEKQEIKKAFFTGTNAILDDYHIDDLAKGYCHLTQLPFITRLGQEWQDNASIMRGMPTVSLKSSTKYTKQKLICKQLVYHIRY